MALETNLVYPAENHLIEQVLTVSHYQRIRLNGHNSFTLWFTGLSGSGKSTIANLLEIELHKQGIKTYILDGDNTRMGINKDLDFSLSGRKENIRRVAEMARIMNDAGLLIISSFISPIGKDRELAKEIIGKTNFVEVFIDTSLDVCIKRDPKGLYQKALQGEIENFTGIDSIYETPSYPQIHIQTETMLPDACVMKIYQAIGPYLQIQKNII